MLLSAVSSFLLLTIERYGVRVLEGFFGLLIGVMVVSFAVSGVSLEDAATLLLVLLHACSSAVGHGAVVACSA